MRLFVSLTRDEFDRLREVARSERRRPQDQAAVLLVQSLDLHGAVSQSTPPQSSLPFEQVGGDREPVEAGAR